MVLFKLFFFKKFVYIYVINKKDEKDKYRKKRKF
jgi:hypothetical protein